MDTSDSSQPLVRQGASLDVSDRGNSFSVAVDNGGDGRLEEVNVEDYAEPEGKSADWGSPTAGTSVGLSPGGQRAICHGLIRVGSEVNAVAFSPDGHSVATGSNDAVVRIWSRDGRLVRALRGHKKAVTSLAYSPNNRRLASGSWDETVRAWDVESHTFLHELEGHDAVVRALAFSHDSQRLVSGGGDDSVRFWDAAGGEQLSRGLEVDQRMSAVAFFPDGQRVVCGTEAGAVAIWDANPGGEKLRALEGHAGCVLAVAVSPDARRVASGGQDRTVRLWDADDDASGESQVCLPGHASAVYAVVFSPNGRWVASGSYDGAVLLWGVDTGQRLGALDGHTGCVLSLMFSPDGTYLASGSDDDTVRLWAVPPVLTKGGPPRAASLSASPSPLRRTTASSDGSEGRPIPFSRRAFKVGSDVNAVAFSPGGYCAAVGSDDGVVRIWDVRTDRKLCALRRHTREVLSVAYSPDARSLASGSTDGTVVVWDAPTGREVRVLEDPKEEELEDPEAQRTVRMRSVAFSPDSQWLASAGDDHVVRLWQVVDGAILRLAGHTSGVSSVAFSPCNGWLVSASDDKSLRVWGLPGGQPLRVLEGHTGWVRSVAVAPNGRLIASGGDDGTVRLWDASEGSGNGELRCLQRNSADSGDQAVDAVAYSPDSCCVAGGLRDGTVCLWNAADGRELCEIKGHQRATSSLAFSSDGACLATGSWDGTVRAWPVRLRTVTGWVAAGQQSEIRCVAFSPDGAYIATTGDDDHLVHLWDAQTGVERRALEGHKSSVWTVAFAPSAPRRLVSGNPNDHTVRVWDVETGTHRCLNYRNASSAMFHPTNANWVASGSCDGTICVWDLSATEEESGRRVLQCNQGGINCVAASPDGQHIASGGHDGSVRLHRWHDASNEDLPVLRAHTDSVLCLAFSPDSQFLSSGSGDHSVRVWHVQGSVELHCLLGDTSLVFSVAFSADGQWVFSGSDDKTLRLWDVSTRTDPGPPESVKPVVTELPHTVWGLALSPTGAIAVGQDKYLVLLNPSVLGRRALAVGDPTVDTDSDVDVRVCDVLPAVKYADPEFDTDPAVDTDSAVDTDPDVDTDPAVAPRPVRWQAVQWLIATKEEGPLLERLLSADCTMRLAACDAPVFRVLQQKGATLMAEALQHLIRGVQECNQQWADRPPLYVSAHTPYHGVVLQPLLSYRLTASLCAVAAEYPVLLSETLSQLPLLQVSRPQFGELPWRDQPFVTVGSSSAEYLPWHTVAEVAGHTGSPNVRRVEHCVVPLPYALHPGVAGFSVPRWLRFRASRRVAPAAEDTVDQTLPHPQQPSFIRSLIEANRVELFESITVQAIVAHKWEKFGRRIFSLQFGLYGVCQAALVAFSLIVPSLADADLAARLSSPDCSAPDIAATLMALLGGVLLALEGAYEAWQLAAERPAPLPRPAASRPAKPAAMPGQPPASAPTQKVWLTVGRRGLDHLWGYARDGWNVLHVAEIALGWAALICWLCGSPAVAPLLSVALYLRWFGVFYYLQPYYATGRLVRMILEIIKDIRWLLAVLAVAVAAAANAFFLLARPGDCAATDAGAACPATPYEDVGTALFTMFNMVVLNSFNTDDFTQGPYAVQLQVMFFTTMLLVTIVLLNLLIALMGNSYSIIESRSSMELCMLRAKLIAEIERTLLTADDLRNPDWFPAFLHVIVPEGCNQPRTMDTQEVFFQKVNAGIHAVDAGIHAVDRQVGEQATEHRQRGEAMEQRLARMEDHLTTCVSEAVGEVKACVKALAEKRIGRLEAKLEARLEAVEAGLEARLKAVEARLAEVGRSLGADRTKLADIEPSLGLVRGDLRAEMQQQHQEVQSGLQAEHAGLDQLRELMDNCKFNEPTGPWFA